MKKIVAMLSILALFFLFSHSAFSAAPRPSEDPDAKIKREMIKRSIESFKGECPCPFSLDKKGNVCGKNSSYSKPWSPNPPMCYFRNIDKPMIEAYLKKKEAEKQAKKSPKKPKPVEAAPKPKTDG